MRKITTVMLCAVMVVTLFTVAVVTSAVGDESNDATLLEIGDGYTQMPPSPYFTHTRPRDEKLVWGGDDDHNNIWFFEADPALKDGTSNPDFFIWIFDGDNDAQNQAWWIGNDDVSLGLGTRGATIFEYRLYGGVEAATNDDVWDGGDPLGFAGTLIDIDEDGEIGDFTLRTDDPDDNDGNSANDLYDQDWTRISVDIDSNPGDEVNGMYIYKLVSDGTIGTTDGTIATDWNRYRVGLSNNEDGSGHSGLSIFSYELTIAGAIQAEDILLHFWVPDIVDDQIDIQTLDMDYQEFWEAWTTLTLPNGTFYDDSQTYESPNQWYSGFNKWWWTSLNQPESLRPAGDGVTGVTYDTSGNENAFWLFTANPLLGHNPFSIRTTGGTRMGPVPPTEVGVDIKPGSDPNSIGLSDQGNLPVAILGSDTFDVETIDPESIEIDDVTLAARGSVKRPKLAYSYEDVNGDGYMDLVAFFEVQDLVNTGVLTDATIALTLTATLFDGTPIQGTDSVNIVP